MNEEKNTTLPDYITRTTVVNQTVQKLMKNTKNLKHIFLLNNARSFGIDFRLF